VSDVKKKISGFLTELPKTSVYIDNVKCWVFKAPAPIVVVKVGFIFFLTYHLFKDLWFKYFVQNSKKNCQNMTKISKPLRSEE
jgi:hypothetical protein